MAPIIHRRQLTIAWGDCDPAGIVFFPRYFAMFDSCTTALFSKALGMSKYEFTRHYEFQGYPMVDTKAFIFCRTELYFSWSCTDHLPPLLER